MARPKVVAGEYTAYQKIEKAFWTELSEKEFFDYSITADGSIKLTLPPCSVIHLEV